tara:strand:+ start:3202 stop:3885 length:684 start_codon:yes stop_codon:yes gene_type:complete
MDEIKFIYFEDCPEAKNVRAALLVAGIYDFKIIVQDQLPEGNPYLKFSSPSVLAGEELIYGIRTDTERASCTFDVVNLVDDKKLTERLRELKFKPFTRNRRSSNSLLGTGLSILLVLKCPACIPGVLAFLSAIGLSFIITPTLLKSVLVLMLLFTLSGLLYSYTKSHRSIYPLMFGVLFSIGLYVGQFYYMGSINQFITYGAVTGLILTTLWDLKLKTSYKSCAACP